LLSLSISTPLGAGELHAAYVKVQVPYVKPHASGQARALHAADMIRKTSLLRKIEPTTRRSSFVGKDMCDGSDASKAFVVMILEITQVSQADCSARILFGSISSLRCQKSRKQSLERPRKRSDVIADFKQALPRWRIL
jgi:demethoxyubiquinone hydroxylase (CLK1/Coq7/Cat5 family)